MVRHAHFASFMGVSSKRRYQAGSSFFWNTVRQTAWTGRRLACRVDFISNRGSRHNTRCRLSWGTERTSAGAMRDKAARQFAWGGSSEVMIKERTEPLTTSGSSAPASRPLLQGASFCSRHDHSYSVYCRFSPAVGTFGLGPSCFYPKTSFTIVPSHHRPSRSRSASKSPNVIEGRRGVKTSKLTSHDGG